MKQQLVVMQHLWIYMINADCFKSYDINDVHR